MFWRGVLPYLLLDDIKVKFMYILLNTTVRIYEGNL